MRNLTQWFPILINPLQHGPNLDLSCNNDKEQPQKVIIGKTYIYMLNKMLFSLWRNSEYFIPSVFHNPLFLQ